MGERLRRETAAGWSPGRPGRDNPHNPWRAEGEKPVKVSPVPRIAGALLFQPTPHTDERGFFSRTFDSGIMREAGIDPCSFVQDSLSRSVRGVVRGLHVRSGAGEAKLVRCSYGAIFDVIVDLRPDSPTYRNWESFELRDEQQVSLYIPAGCAHGFQALTDPADVSYRIDRPHDPSEDVSIRFDEPELAIPWPLPVTVISQRDRTAASFDAAVRSLS
jgi:dTDP-4-dehydrorhamnose 3,5-epimerase